MTKIDFYHLCEVPFSGILPFAARLADKITRMNHQIYFHAPDHKTTESISDALWSSIPETFLPHMLPGESGESTRIEVGFDQNPDQHHDVLINLDGKIPSFFSRFQRVVEILPDEEPHKTVARERYKFYKDRGYPVNYHEIAQK